MKLRKILSSVVAGAVALSAMTFSASAEAKTVLDFEDGVMDGIKMHTDAGADKSILSVVDFGGSKQLWVDIQKDPAVPKVFFDIGAILGYDNMDKVAGVSLDVTIQSTLIVDESDPENPVYDITSWQGGGAGIQDGEGGSLGWTEVGGWTCEDYEDGNNTIHYEGKFNGTFTNGTEGSHFLFMKWASANNPVDMYIDNVTFYDADGNAMELYPSAEAAEEETTEEETATEEVEEEATEEEAEEEEAEEEEAEEEEAEEEAEEVEEEAEEEETEEVVEEATEEVVEEPVVTE